ncbi:MAG: sugar transferase [Clostridia bacterium]|nr:sugar transferase [Clostridia bacterium]
MLFDILIINISIIIAFLLRFQFTLPVFNFQPYMEMSLWISLGGVFFFNVYHLYSVSARTRWDDQFYSIIFAVTLNLMLTITITYISANYSFPRSVFIIGGFLQVVLLVSWRYLLWKFTKTALGEQNAIIIGEPVEAVEIAHRFKEFSESHINVIGIISNQLQPTESEGGYKVLGLLPDVDKIVEQTEYDVIVITPSLDAEIKKRIISRCYSAGKEVFLIPDLYEVLLIKANLNLIDDIPVFNIKDSNGDNNQAKRMLDLIIGTIALVLTLPALVIVAIIIKLDSPGPVIYKQERVTKGGRVFVLYKFRTMVQDAEQETGPVFAVEDDQRATRVGRMLRLSRLDEIPQLFNVLKGDMSLVGPRPERPIFVEQFSKEIDGYDNRHRLKPGITGIAQIAGKYNTGPREKLVFDLLYAKKNDILVDLQILLHTIKVLFLRDKAS